MILEAKVKRPRIMKVSINNRLYDKLRELHVGKTVEFINAKYKMIILNVEMKSTFNQASCLV